MSSTVIRVPLMTGLPTMILGSDTINGSSIALSPPFIIQFHCNISIVDSVHFHDLFSLIVLTSPPPSYSTAPFLSAGPHSTPSPAQSVPQQPRSGGPSHSDRPFLKYAPIHPASRRYRRTRRSLPRCAPYPVRSCPFANLPF